MDMNVVDNSVGQNSGALYSEAQMVITIGFSEPAIDPHTRVNTPCCLLPLNNRPLLYHIMHFYNLYGFNNFVLMCNENIYESVVKCLCDLVKAAEIAPNSWCINNLHYRVFKSSKVYLPSELLVRMVEEDHIQADNIYVVPSHCLCTLPPSILLDAHRASDATVTVLLANNTCPNGIHGFSDTKETKFVLSEFEKAYEGFPSESTPVLDYVECSEEIKASIRSTQKFDFTACKDGILVAYGNKGDNLEVFKNPTPTEILQSQLGIDPASFDSSLSTLGLGNNNAANGGTSSAISTFNKKGNQPTKSNSCEIEMQELLYMTPLNKGIISSDTDLLEMPLHLLQRTPTSQLRVFDSKPFVLVIAREFIPVLHQVESIIDLFVDLPAFVAEQANLDFELMHPAIRKYLDLSADVFSVNEAFHMVPTASLERNKLEFIQNFNNTEVEDEVSDVEDDIAPISPITASIGSVPITTTSSTSLSNVSTEKATSLQNINNNQEANKLITDSTIIECLSGAGPFASPGNNGVSSSLSSAANNTTNPSSNINTVSNISTVPSTSTDINNDLAKNNACSLPGSFNVANSYISAINEDNDDNKNFFKPYSLELKKKREYQKLNIGAGHGISGKTIKNVGSIINRHISNDFAVQGEDTTLANFLKPKRSIIITCVLFSRDTYMMTSSGSGPSVTNLSSSGSQTENSVREKQSVFSIDSCSLITVNSPQTLMLANRILKEYTDMPSIPQNDINYYNQFSPEFSEPAAVRNRRLELSNEKIANISNAIEEKVRTKYFEAIDKIEKQKAVHAAANAEKEKQKEQQQKNTGKPQKEKKGGKKNDSNTQIDHEKEIHNITSQVLTISGLKHKPFVFLPEEFKNNKDTDNVQGFVDMDSHFSIKSKLAKNAIVIDSIVDDFCDIRSYTDDVVEAFAENYRQDEEQRDNIDPKKAKKAKKSLVTPQEVGIYEPGVVNYFTCNKDSEAYTAPLYNPKNTIIKRSIIGENVIIEAGAQIFDCVIMDHAIIGKNTRLVDCFINSPQVIIENNVSLTRCQVGKRTTVKENTTQTDIIY